MGFPNAEDFSQCRGARENDIYVPPNLLNMKLLLLVYLVQVMLGLGVLLAQLSGLEEVLLGYLNCFH